MYNSVVDVDIDECSEVQHICEQNCTNNPGSYECSCNIKGYEVSPVDSSRCNGDGNDFEINQNINVFVYI